MSKVYFKKKITTERLVKTFDALNIDLKGKIGIKISSGELGGHNYLKPELIKDLVNKLNGTLIECCTAYEGKRTNPTDHYKVIKAHGFDKFNFDLMDEKGEFTLKVNNGFHLKENIVGENLKKYQSLVILSHFKGHAMGGFGGALKNMSIGIASPKGKANIHTAGKVKDPSTLWDNLPKQDDFLESMADACKSIIEYIGKEKLSSRTAIIAFILSALALVPIRNTAMAAAVAVSCIVFQRATGRKVRIMPHIVLFIFLMISSVLTPSGKVLFRILSFPITDGAVQAAMLKSFKLSASIALSQGFSRAIAPQSGFLGQVLSIFSALLASFHEQKGSLAEKVQRTLASDMHKNSHTSSNNIPAFILIAITVLLILFSISDYLFL